MGEGAHPYFERLKEAVWQTYQAAHPACGPIQEWRGQEIVDFQEELSEKVNGRISEKWFYTHIKSANTGKLPRIDMLDLLSQYAGHANWKAFQHAERMNEQAAVPSIAEEEAISVLKRPRKIAAKWWGMGAIALGGMLIVALLGLTSQATYTFCFLDADTGKAIEAGEQIAVSRLIEGETPVVKYGNKQACIQIEAESGKMLELVVQAPYYQSDTIRRNYREGSHEETIRLKVDDYALMIHLFSTSNLKDWKKRRRQLDEIISDEARIFQVYEGMGVEMYNKEEFINKLTSPLKSLKQIEVIQTQYDEDQRIKALRFIQRGE